MTDQGTIEFKCSHCDKRFTRSAKTRTLPTLTIRADESGINHGWLCDECAKNTYICDLCHQRFKKGWTDDEAEGEAKDIWGVDNAATHQDMSVVCDDCFKKAMGNDELPN